MLPHHPALKNEDIRLLFEALRQMLDERAYQRRVLTWYSYSRALIRVLHLAPALTRNRIWFALGIALRALDGVEDRTVWDSIRPLRCRATHPQIEDCAVSVRLQRLVEDRARFVTSCHFTDATVSHSASVPHILQVISQVALPFLESFNTLEDVRTFVHSERAPVCTIREPAKTILSRI
jgi:hypothetical protein